ncbi:MAG TPA: 5'-nucleotidase C-terminal domain-containing protein [Chitinophagaceae bacterium]|jgi:2',3'-cyclic-nucleotide 2'-phosphodiesterase (5'-nucleotidase family)|nr:5'-nucleotidase C-terminal domain-containing protein [Chitinophagaceae bacterium]
MRKNPSAIFLALLLLFTGYSCTTSYQTSALQYKSYRISDGQQKDSSLLTFLKPYGEQVNKTMNEVVGVAAISLDKAQPECTLGNMMVDAFMTMAAEKYNTKVDGALVNFGGIRLTQLPKGNITTGKIFELMPFDNLLLLQKMKGSVLQQVLDLAAAKGGWPLAGITMQIRDKKAVNVKVGGQPLDMNATYTIANSDFIANGGDNADMLRTIPQITNGYLMRDAIIDYIRKHKAEGKEISSTIENRVTNAQ